MNLVTPTGRLIDPANPRPEDICLRDIALGLAKEKRFGGNTLVPYSVAQHSVHVAELCRASGGDQLKVTEAFLHDASEAYLGDIVQPLKRLLPDYRKLEDTWMNVIAERFGLPTGFQHDPDIKAYDGAIFVCEVASLVENSMNYRITPEFAAAHKDLIVRKFLPNLENALREDLNFGVWPDSCAARFFLAFANVDLNLK